jgi:hypothetical protein
MALACEPPQAAGRPLTPWPSRDVADEVVQRGMVTALSRATVSRVLTEAQSQPHRSRYWLHAQPPEAAPFAEQGRRLGARYRQAAPLPARGMDGVGVDEHTGMPALEHSRPANGVRPGWSTRLEAESSRHGTLCLIAHWHVATGHLLAPTVGATRTEADFLQHIQHPVALDPHGPWLFVVANRNTPQAATLVAWVAQQGGLPTALAHL